MLKYANEFTVTGKGDVPLDMMRYDRCTPLTQKDVDDAYIPTPFGLRQTVSVRLIRYTEGKGRNYHDNPTVKRWNSFGWKVTDITWRKI